MNSRQIYFAAPLFMLVLIFGCGSEEKQTGAKTSAPGDNQAPATSSSNLEFGTPEPGGSLEVEQAYHLNQVAKLKEQEDDLNIAGKMKLAGHYFMSGQFEKAIEIYDAVISLAPALEPRLWQRGLALYYANEFEKGVAQFETHQTVNSADVENSVWHFLCSARETDLETARSQMIEIQGDTRIPMREIYRLFRGEAKPEDVLKAAETTGPEVDRQSQKYYAHLYIGLYYEIVGESQKSLESLQKATELNDMPIDTLMGQVARAHLQLRETEKQVGE